MSWEGPYLFVRYLDGKGSIGQDEGLTSRVVITNIETQKKSPTFPHLMRKLMEADSWSGSSINAITSCIFPPAMIFQLMIPAVAADNKRWRILKHFPCDHIEASKLTHKLHILN
jgi:hypothetical protein